MLDSSISEENTVTIPTAKLGERISVWSDIEYPKSNELAKIFAKTSPAVVQLFTTKDEPHGSGFFTEKDGTITTAYHCVQFEDAMVVRTADNKTFRAKVLDINPSKDTAHLKIEAPGLTFPALKFRQSTSDLKPGDFLMALGHPGESPKLFMAPGSFVNRGPATEQGLTPVEVSGRNNLLPTVQANMHVENGNSGGPVVDENGEVVGLTSSGNKTTDQIIPAETIRHASGLAVEPYYPGYLPHELSWGPKATVHATEAGIVGLTGLAGLARTTRVGAAIMGAAEFSFQDLTPLVSAYHSGTRAEKASATLEVVGDALMIGSIAIAGHGRGLATALTGIGLKLANQVGSHRRFW